MPNFNEEKKKKKNKKELGWWQTFNNGDVEKSTDFFNNAMGASEGGEASATSACEGMTNLDAFYALKDEHTIYESNTSRIYQHITEDDKWAIVSPYRSERSEKENRIKMNELKSDVKKYGFIQFVSRWVEDGIAFDERSLLIPNIDSKDALNLGKKYNQASVIIKDENGCREICTTPFETFQVGDVVRTYNINGDNVMNIKDAEDIFSKRKGGPASKPIKGGKAFHLSEVYEVEEPRPSYFQKAERLNLIWGGNYEEPILENREGIDALGAIYELNKLEECKSNFMNELDYASDNGNPMQVLDEETVNRITTKHNDSGYCILSACRSRFYKDGTEVPRGEEASDSELLKGEKLASINNKRTLELKKMIIEKNYSFLPVYGGFKEEGASSASFEKSFIVFNFDRRGNTKDINDLVNDCMEMGKHFNQDSILVKKPNSKPYYANCTTGEVDVEFDGDYTLNDLTQMYFTALKKVQSDDNLKGKPQRFTFEGVYINPKPISVHESTRRHYMNEIF